MGNFVSSLFNGNNNSAVEEINPNAQRAQKIIEMIQKKEKIPIEEVQWACSTSSEIFLKESSVIDVNSPVIVVGDVHAQIDAVNYIFNNYGAPEKTKYVFLGDYVDRGPESFYTIMLLLAYKIKLGSNIIMIRGNHEDIEISKQYQFKDDVVKKYNDPNLMNDFNTVFTSIPIGVLINNTILCIHGGLGPAVRTVDTIRNIKRPFVISDQDPLYDIFWADPQKNVEDWGNGKRATSCSFGVTPLREFFERSNITGLIRGHEVAAEGYEYNFGEDVNFVTLFSAPSYGMYKNKASVLFIDENGKYTFKSFSGDDIKPKTEE